MYAYSKLTVFLELRSRKSFRFSEQKLLSIYSAKFLFLPFRWKSVYNSVSGYRFPAIRDWKLKI